MSLVWNAGIIPACAGSTCRVSSLRRCARDHPRMCGEHGWQCRPGHGAPGSSPHVRGAPDRLRPINPFLGIIPACAGSTEPLKPPRIVPGDHPRMCGEHMRNRRSTRRQKGSSPHVRGAPACAIASVRTSGIIPACAGSTSAAQQASTGYGDHPRMCGEHIVIVKMSENIAGSSPHVRGARAE